MADDIRSVAQEARAATIQLAQSTESERNDALEAIARGIEADVPAILEANVEDLAAAQKMADAGTLSQALVDRLKLTESKVLDTIVPGVRSVKDQPDPVGRTLMARELDEGMTLYQVSVPIGVIGVIFESRPDALVQIATLCLKSGNASLLKGGSEALRTNRVLARIMLDATRGLPGIPEGWMHLLEAREEVQAMLDLHDLIDLIIPRGGNELVQHIMANTRIPVTGHTDGICHLYVDSDADLDKAIAVTFDAKTDYVSVCNALETLLVHESVAGAFLPRMIQKLQAGGVEVRGDESTRRVVSDGVVAATDEDWATEYLELILSVKVVASLDEAVEHINTYGSHHTDCILTENEAAASRFIQSVDSASVLQNVSTRFADGFRYGLGAEVGVSTGRIHSRGPVGLEGLMIYKYVLKGDGHLASTYQGENAKPFTHRDIDEVWRP